MWGEPKDDGSRYVHTLQSGAELSGRKHHFYPREFKLIGWLVNGLECDLGDLYSLAKYEPTALLEAGSDDWLQIKQEGVLDACRELERGVIRPSLDQIASLTRGDGVVLTFPKILEVSERPDDLMLL